MHSNRLWKRLQKYRIGFDGWGLGLFLVIMLPNFIWFSIPAPVDILRRESVTGGLDMAAGVCQVLLAASLVCVVRRERPKGRFVFPAAACLGYYAAWAAYYLGAAGPGVILALSLLPCAAFLLFAAGRKNYIAAVPAAVFTVCHSISAAINFM